MAAFTPPKCPVCDHYCTVEIDRDYMQCPFHGYITGLAALQVRGMPKYEALSNIRAQQISDMVYRMSAYVMDEFDRNARHWVSNRAAAKHTEEGL